MRFVRITVLLLAVLHLTACVNFGAVREFSDETAKLTTSTAAEIKVATENCGKVANVRKIVENVDTSKSACNALTTATAELSKNTKDILITGLSPAPMGSPFSC